MPPLGLPVAALPPVAPWCPASKADAAIASQQRHFFVDEMNSAAKSLGALIPYYGEDPSHILETDRANLKAAVNGSLSARSGLSPEACRSFVDGWARGTNFELAVGIALQVAAADAFSLPRGAYVDGLVASLEAAAGSVSVGDGEPGVSPDSRLIQAWLRRERRRLPGLLAAAPAFVAATYEATQDFLSSRGIREVAVFRGMQFAENPEPAWSSGSPPEGVFPVSFAASPLSAFSLDAGLASVFADSADPNRPGVVLSCKAPAGRVFSLPFTGMGCFTEAEAVLLGGTMDCVAARKPYDGLGCPPSYGEGDPGRFPWTRLG